jgi:hypothetical protein
MEKSKISDYTLISGGCKGADLEWERIGLKYGLEHVKHLKTNYYDSRNESTKALVEDYYREVCANLNRPTLLAGTYAGKLVRRNMLITLNSDSVFAIGSLVFPGEKDSYGNINKNRYPIVTGGTAYSVELARIMKKPVFVLDQDEGEWWVRLDGDSVIEVNGYMRDHNPKGVAELVVPQPTKVFAGIGSRHIGGYAIERIEEFFQTLASS